jgi:hypothetical protein
MSGVPINQPGTDPATLARISALETTATSLDGKIAAKADISAIPTPSDMVPPGVADNGATGNMQMIYALANHTHASKARKGKTSVSTSTYSWTYPTAFPAGTSPVVSAIAQVAAGNADLFNVQVIGTPTNTGCVFQINRVSAGLLALLLGALSINATPATITLHMIALEP